MQNALKCAYQYVFIIVMTDLSIRINIHRKITLNSGTAFFELCNTYNKQFITINLNAILKIHFKK